jgi:hypothetical protein
MQILVLISLLTGIIICGIGMKTKNILYKGGFFFFLLSFIASVYSLAMRFVMNVIIQNLTDKGANNIGRWVANLNIPGTLFTAAGLVIFIIFLLRGLDQNREHMQ